MKKKLCLLLVICMLLSICAACGNTTANTDPKTTEATTREFVDSTGRTVTVPAEIQHIAISGPLSQVYIIPIAADMLVGVSSSFAEDEKLYLPDSLTGLPELGQLYGGKGEMDLEALLAADPDVVIDIGEAKDTIVEDMNSLTEQTGIPFIHIDATVKTSADAYRMLGDLLGRKDKAEELATWCESTFSMISDMMEKVDADNARKTMLYCLGDAGVNVLAEGSFHAETVNMLSKNLAVIDDVVSSGGGNETDLEQIILWNPEVIVFAPDSIYDTVGQSAEWKSVNAIASGNYYKTPYGPYGWLSSPHAVQRYLGMLWLGALLYPDYAEYDLQEEVTDYYKLFYGCDLTDEMYNDLIKDAM